MDYIQELKDIGCPKHLEQEYIKIMNEEKIEERILFLKRLRCSILGELHRCNKEIDCIDYIIHELTGGKNNG